MTQLATGDKIRGGEIIFSICYAPAVTPRVFDVVNEKLSALLDIKPAEIVLDPSYDSDSYEEVWSGVKSGNLAVPFHPRKGGKLYPYLLECVRSGTFALCKYEDPFRTVEAWWMVGGLPPEGVGNAEIVKINSAFRLKTMVSEIITPVP